MIRDDKWPFIPESLSEIFDNDTLSVIESGCCERIRRPLTILVRDIAPGQFNYRVESINEKQRYEPFCGYLRNEKNVIGMDNRCKKYDIVQAAKSLELYTATREAFRIFTCHMHLSDMTNIIEIKGHPVALAITGQYCGRGDLGFIQEEVKGLGQADFAEIQLDEQARKELLALTSKLPQVPEGIREYLQREAGHIQRIAEDKYERLKRQWEQEFLDRLQKLAVTPGSLTRQELTTRLGHALEAIQGFCRCRYAAFFGSVMEGDMVLVSLAACGVPSAIQADMPHFNWKKAGLPTDSFDGGMPDLAAHLGEYRLKGIRSHNHSFFEEAACIIPVALNNRYRGVLVMGPFEDEVNISAERRFLYETANTIGLFTLSGLEFINLEQERHHWEKMARLLSHQMGTVLTPVNTLIGWAKYRLQHPEGGLDTIQVIDFIKQAEDMTMVLATSARETLQGRVLNIKNEDLKEVEDYKFERYPLSVLVSNCAISFVERARLNHRDLLVETSVERLPDADMDVARLTIVLANLIDNAIKYSLTDSKIYVRSHLDAPGNIESATAVIEIDDLGLGIRVEEEDKIFSQGSRGEMAKKAGIAGSGFGLWEADMIVKAHGGKILLKHWPIQVPHREGHLEHVVFSLIIPLVHKK